MKFDDTDYSRLYIYSIHVCKPIPNINIAHMGFEKMALCQNYHDATNNGNNYPLWEKERRYTY